MDQSVPDARAEIGANLALATARLCSAERTTIRVVEIFDRCLNHLDWAVEFCERCDQAFALSDLAALVAARDRLAGELAARSL
jgi:hypothetical protein